MRVFDITFRSITYAQRGKSALESGGIRCSMGRTPRWMEERGCGYRLRVPERQGVMAVALLQNRGIPYSKVYTGGEGEPMEEYRP